MRQSFGTKMFVFTIILVLLVVGSITFRNSQAMREDLERQYQSTLIDGTQLLGERIVSILTRWDNRLSYLSQTLLSSSSKKYKELTDDFMANEESVKSLQIFRVKETGPDIMIEQLAADEKPIPGSEWSQLLSDNEVRIMPHPRNAAQGVLIRRLTLRGSTDTLLLAMAFRMDVLPISLSSDDKIQSYLLDPEFRDLVTGKNYKSIVPVKSFVKKAQKLIQGDLGAGYLGELKTSKGSYFVAYHRLPTYPLFVVTHRDSSVIGEALRVFLLDMLRWTIFFVLVAIGFSSFILRNLLGNLRELYAATMRLASGDFKHKVSVRSNDELGQLSAAFNLMTHKIVELLAGELEKARLDQELSVAQSVQNTFFKDTGSRSRNLMLTSFYQPASACGGDWWGHFTLNNNKELIVIGDATGHGVPAALVTAIAYASTHILTEQMLAGAIPANDPAAILRALNTLLYHTLRGKLCMSFLAMVIDAETRTMTFSNAGHPFPLLIPLNAKDDRLGENPKLPYRALLQKRKSSCILGLESDSTFHNETIQLVHGDKIILHTDGLTELENAEGKQWGTRPIKQFLKAHSQEDPSTLCQSMMKEAISFNKEANVFADDLTLIIMEFKSDEVIAA